MRADSNKEHYDFVLMDLQKQRDECRRQLEEAQRATLALTQRLNELAVIISSLSKHHPARSEMVSASAPAAPETRVANYAGISMRWAILLMLCEHVSGGIGRTQIADALQTGGVSSKGKDFLSIVSAVLSQMSAKGEVRQVEDGWMVTSQGREVWEQIKKTEQYRSRVSLAA